MDAIVLAGGFGTRLKSVVSDVPKPMAPVAGRPFLEILLQGLAFRGFKRVVLAVGYKSDVIQAHFGDAFAGLTLVYSFEDQPLGTGGAIRKALASCETDPVFVFNGDTYLALETDAVVAQWKAHGDPIVVVRPVADAGRYGRVETEDGRITRFSEKGVAGPGSINAGCYVFPRDLLDRYPIEQAFSLENDFLASAIHERSFRVFETGGLFIDIGVPEDFARAQVDLADVERA